MFTTMLQAGLPPLPSDFPLRFVLLDVAIILVAARALGWVAQKAGQPRVVGEIVAGVLLGPSLLGPETLHWTESWAWMHCDQALGPAGAANESISACFFPAQSKSVLGILGQIALVFFMFLVGLELNYGLLKGKYKGIITVALGVIALPVVFGFIIGPVLFEDTHIVAGKEVGKFVGAGIGGVAPSKIAFSLMIGAMLSVTAFPVMARILQEKGLTQSNMGAIGVAAAAIVTVLMFVVVVVATNVAKDADTSTHIKAYVKIAIYLAVMAAVVPRLIAPLGKRYETNGFNAEFLVWCAVLMFASSWMAQRLGLGVIVGGFMAGAVMPARALLFKDMSTRLSDLTSSILLPIFLAFSGLQTDFTKLKPEFWAGIAIFLVAGVFAKWAGGAVFARLGGLSWAEGNVIGVLMNCRGLLILVVALIALNDAKVISPQMQIGGVLMALITTMMTGPLFDKFLPSATKAGKAA
jgi:Kef-type K+ transport system membrane component KefB